MFWPQNFTYRIITHGLSLSNVFLTTETSSKGKVSIPIVWVCSWPFPAIIKTSSSFKKLIAFFIATSLLLISKFPSYSFKKIVIQRKATIFLLFGIVLFVGLLLIYPFNVISISAIIYLGMLPISFFHYQKLKKQNEDQNYKDEDDDLEDILWWKKMLLYH